MVSELEQDPAIEGYLRVLERPIAIEHLPQNATVAGKIDCLAITDEEARVYDCKTGREKPSHEIQVMIYMYALSQEPELSHLDIHGEIRYADGRAIEVPLPGPEFGQDLKHFVELLARDVPAPKVPGYDCRFCPITRADCQERVEQ